MRVFAHIIGLFLGCCLIAASRYLPAGPADSLTESGAALGMLIFGVACAFLNLALLAIDIDKVNPMSTRRQPSTSMPMR